MSQYYQGFNFDTARILDDMKTSDERARELSTARESFLYRLVNEGFEVLYQESPIIAGFPETIIVGADELPIKMRVYEMAMELKLGDYIGSGPFYRQHVSKQQISRRS